MIKADERYFAERSDGESGEPIYLDNEVIEASNDQEAIGKAGELTASHKLGVVAMLISNRASGASIAGRFIWEPKAAHTLRCSLSQ